MDSKISKIILTLLILPGLSLLTSCSGIKSTAPGSDSSEQQGWYKPAPGTSWQWQLQGNIDTNLDVDMYDIDLFDSSPSLIAGLQASGKKVICYFSGGSFEDWRDDASDFPTAVKGNPLDGWPGEKWLDIRADSVRSIMQTRMDLAVTKGCDGVEPDNMDGYSNSSGFPLTAADQLDYNRFIANEAHKRNLAVGLKNDIEQLPDLVDYFDFAMNEECFAYNECEAYSVFTNAGKAVFNAEYDSNDVNCATSIALNIETLLLPLALDGSFRISCE